MLWDVDYTLLNASGLGTRLYEMVFRQLFGRELPAVAPKAGRTDRAIAGDTLALAGVTEPQAQVDGFLAALARQVAAIDGTMNEKVRALPGAAAAIAALWVRPRDQAVCPDGQHRTAGGDEATCGRARPAP